MDYKIGEQLPDDFAIGQQLPDDYEPDYGGQAPVPQRRPSPPSPAAPAPQQKAPPPERTKLSPGERAPAPQAPQRVAPQQEFKIGEQLPDDYEPDYGVARPALSETAFTRGMTGALKQSAAEYGQVADAMNAFFEGGNKSWGAELSKYLTPDPNAIDFYRRQVPTMKDIPGEGVLDTAGRALTYVGESAGAGLGSTMESLVGGTVGGVAGAGLMSETGPVGMAGGAFAGRWIGASAPAIKSGIAGLWSDLNQDKGVQQLLKEGKITPKEVSNYAVTGGILIGAIDAFGAEKFIPKGSKLLGAANPAAAASHLVRESVKRAFLTGMAKGALAEGSTEALQEIIGQGFQAGLGGNLDAVNRAWSVAESMVQGALGGTLMGGTEKAHEAAVHNAKLGANPAPAAGTGAPPAGPNAGGGQPTPGNTGATAAAPAAGAAAQHTAPGPVKTPAAGTPAASQAAKNTQPVNVQSGQPDPAAAAALAPKPAPQPGQQTGAPQGPEPSLEESPDYIEPSVSEDQEVYDYPEEDEDAEPNLPSAQPAQTSQVSGAGADTDAALNAATAPPAAPKSRQETVNDIVTNIVQSVQQPPNAAPAATGAGAIAPAPTAMPAGVPGLPRTIMPAEVTNEAVRQVGRNDPTMIQHPEFWNVVDSVASDMPGARPRQAANEIRRRMMDQMQRPAAGPAPAPEPSPIPVAAQATEDLAPAQTVTEPAPEPAVSVQEAPTAAANETPVTAAEAPVLPTTPPVEQAPPARPTLGLTTERGLATPERTPAEVRTTYSTEGAAPETKISRFELERKKGRGRVREAPRVVEPVRHHEIAETAPAPAPEPKRRVLYKPGEEPETRGAHVIVPGETRHGENIPVGPEGEGPAHNAVSRQLVAEVNAELREAEDRARDPTYKIADPEFHLLSDREGFKGVLDRAARDVSEFANEKKPISEQIPGLVQQLKDTIRSRMEEAEVAEQQRQERQAQQGQQQDVSARQAHIEAKVSSPVKEERPRQRKKGKVAEAIAKEADKTTYDRVKAEREKPEDQQDKSLIKWGEHYDERKQYHWRDKENRDPITAKMDAIRQGWVEARRKVDEQEEAAYQQRLKDVETIKQATTQAREAGASEKEVAAAEAARKAELVSEEVRKRREAAQPIVNKILESMGFDHKNIRTVGALKAMIQRIKTSFRKAKLGPLPDEVDRVKYSPEENLAIFAKRIAEGKEPGENPDSVAAANVLLKASREDPSFLNDFYQTITTNVGQHEMEGFDEKQHGQALALDHALNAMDAESSKDVEQPRGEKPPEYQGDWAKFFYGTDPGTHTFTKDGVTHTVQYEHAMTGTQATHFIQKISPARKGLFGVLRRMLQRRLRALVGDTKVMYVSHEQMLALGKREGVAGTYYHPSRKSMTEGHNGFILIDADRMKHEGPDFAAKTILHELVHAATHFAIDHNIGGTKEILSKMLTSLRQQLGEGHYGLTDIHELVTEAHSNEEFQNLLKTLGMPIDLVNRIGAPTGAIPKWWGKMVAVVQNALGLNGGPKGTTSYLHGIMSLHNDLFQSLEEQRRRATEEFADSGFPLSGEYWGRHGTMSPRQYLNFPGHDLSASVDMAQNQLQAAAYKRSASAAAGVGRRIRDRLFTTTHEIMRRVERMLGSMRNPVTDFAEALLGRDHMVGKFREKGENLAGKLSEFYGRNAVEAEKLVTSLYGATHSGADPSKLLTDPENMHIRGGFRDRAKRRAWRQERAAYQALSPEAKGLWHEVVDFHKDQQDTKVVATIRNIVEGGINNGNIKLQPGVTETHLINHVANGGIDKPIGLQTPHEQQMTQILGNMGQALKRSKEMRKIKGVYVPLTRQGKHFFTAREVLQTPQGARALPRNPKDWHTTFQFANKADAEAFMDHTQYKVAAANPVTVDPATGLTHDPVTGVKYTLGQNVNYTTHYQVKVMDQSMHMGDNLADLENQRQQMDNAGFITKQIDLLDNHMNENADLMPIHVQKLLRAIDQSNKTPAAKAQARASVMDSFVRTTAGSRAAHRTLKRLGIAGHSEDMIQSLLSTNHAMASHLANLHFMPKFAKAEDDIDALRNAMRHNDPRVLALSEMVQELKRRRDAAYRYDGAAGGGTRLSNAIMALSFMKSLASPSFALFNALQLPTVAMPVLGAEGGYGRTLRNTMHNMNEMGALTTYAKGLTDTVGEGVDFLKKSRGLLPQALGGVNNLPRAHDSHHKRVRGILAASTTLRNKLGKLKMMDKLQALGLSSDNGFDVADMSEYGKTKAEKFIHRTARIARQSTEAVEAVNRYVTGLTAFDNAIEMGMTEQQAIDYAVSKVEQTQGGYSAANNPTAFSHPFGRMVLQFKKFPLMFGQLFYGSLGRAMGLSPTSSRADRIVAAKTFASLSLMGVLMSGVYGNPLMEIARMGNLIAQMFGGDDWDKQKSDAEAALQRMFKQLGFGKKVANNTAEALMHGVSRLAGFDMQRRLGTDNLLMFGDPKSTATNDMLLWGLKQAMGAPGQMLADFYTGITTGDMTKMPLPKFAIDGIKAAEMAYKGKKSPSGAKIYQKPSGITPGVILQGLTGVQPRSEVRQFEVGSSYMRQKAKSAATADRLRMAQGWLNARPGRDQNAQWAEIQRWNRGKTGKDRITYSDLIRMRKRRLSDQQKQAQEDRRAAAQQ